MSPDNPLVAAVNQHAAEIFSDKPLDEGLITAAGRIGLDLTIATVHHSSNTNLYLYPGMEDYPILTDAEIRWDITSMVMDYEELNGQNPSNVPKATRRTARNRLASASKSDRLRYLSEHTSVVETLKAMLENDTLGLDRRADIGRVNTANVVHFWPENGMSDELCISEGEGGDLLCGYAFPEESSHESITIEQLSKRLRDMGGVDLSEEFLNRRFKHFTALAQFAASRIFLADAAVVRIMANNQDRALFKLHKQSLLADNYDAKIAMFQSLSEAYGQQASVEKNSYVRRFFEGSLAATVAVANDLIIMREGFKPVYEALGYPLPAELLDDQEESVLGPPETTEKIAVTKSVNDTVEQKVTPDQIAAMTQDLDSRATVLQQQWRMSGKQRREQGFDSLCSNLIRGYADDSGEQLLAGIDKSVAQEITDCLVKLEHLAAGETDLSGACKTVNRSIAEQAALQREYMHVWTLASEAGKTYTTPHIIQLGDHIATLRENWSSYRRLIQNTWPRNEGATAAQKIESLLTAVAVADNS